jgi:hypothetical protein
MQSAMTDFERHVDYIHFNPVKRGYVTRDYKQPYSSFRRYVKNGGDLGKMQSRFGE